ncbi:hypothetical protein J7J24_00235 [bacterium]|nr:hypothetical protein [bacterium]
MEKINLAHIPEEVVHLACEATSEHNDGWTKQGARKQLEEIKKYIDYVLSQDS